MREVERDESAKDTHQKGEGRPRVDWMALVQLYRRKRYEGTQASDQDELVRGKRVF